MAGKNILERPALSGRKHLPGILDAGTLKILLHEERERSNRSGSPFSFLLFTPKNTGANHGISSGFIQTLSDRMRSLDKAGWMENGDIGVILPNTPASGARTLADELIESQETGRRLINCIIYTYPFSMYEG